MQFQFMPDRGAAAATQDVVAGQVDIRVDIAVTAVPQVRAGSIKAYALARPSLSSRR
jgi:tripartite-type tricarboxylate transporter receptor subunit TctC